MKSKLRAPDSQQIETTITPADAQAAEFVHSAIRLSFESLSYPPDILRVQRPRLRAYFRAYGEARHASVRRQILQGTGFYSAMTGA